MTPSNEQTVLEQVDVLPPMAVTCPVSHLEMLALKAAADRNTTHHPNVENNGHEKGGGHELKKNQKKNQ